ncbi:MAG TPA: carboxypeptidase-like regulatory domain-containing protein [Pirellulales bacterium]|jgi:hypothetical protein
MLLFVSHGTALRAQVAKRAPPDTLEFIEGQLVDVQGRKLENATVTAIYMTRADLVTTPPVVADGLGQFRIHKQALPFPIGGMAHLMVETKEGQHFEANVLINRGPLVVHFPTRIGAKISKVDDVAIGELAGTVIDHDGMPLEDVTVNEGYAHTGHETITDSSGQFRLKGFERDKKVEVIFSKPGYSPETFMQQPTGVAGWVVALGKQTYLEGKVSTPDDKPAVGALVRANQGPKLGKGFRRSELWTETKTDELGQYRLYLQPDAYSVDVEAEGVGVARFDKKPVSYGEVQKLDVVLKPGVQFRIKCIDSITGDPVPSVRLHHWQKKKLNAVSDAAGEVVLKNLMPGRFEFDVDPKGYTRWWSDRAMSEWKRKSIDKPALGWQRNFDDLDFDLSPGMAPVTIVFEKGVRIRGRVVDPDGNPVAGATAAPALTATGNSLTGDTRFSVVTKEDGTFEMLLPASNEAKYNLVAHDGKYQQWRNWANGVLPPIATVPGQEINDVEIKLTRGATVRGRVVDANGKPAVRCEVRAHAADLQESRYYDPTVKTNEDGVFELKFVRPGEQLIQCEPMYLDARQGPPQATVVLNLIEGQEVNDVKLVTGADPAQVRAGN